MHAFYYARFSFTQSFHTAHVALSLNVAHIHNFINTCTLRSRRSERGENTLTLLIPRITRSRLCAACCNIAVFNNVQKVCATLNSTIWLLFTDVIKQERSSVSENRCTNLLLFLVNDKAPLNLRLLCHVFFSFSLHANDFQSKAKGE